MSRVVALSLVLAGGCAAGADAGGLGLPETEAPSETAIPVDMSGAGNTGAMAVDPAADPPSPLPTTPSDTGTPPADEAAGTGTGGVPPTPTDGPTTPPAPAEGSGDDPVTSSDPTDTPDADPQAPLEPNFPIPETICTGDSDAISGDGGTPGDGGLIAGDCVVRGDLLGLHAPGGGEGENTVRGVFAIENTGQSDVPLSDLTIRYWYTQPVSSSPQEFACDYASINTASNDAITGMVRARFELTEREGADQYMEIYFDAAGKSLPAGLTAQIQTRFWTRGFQPTYSLADDYSHDPALTSLGEAPRVTVYRQGILVWGAEPPGLP